MIWLKPENTLKKQLKKIKKGQTPNISHDMCPVCKTSYWGHIRSELHFFHCGSCGCMFDIYGSTTNEHLLESGGIFFQFKEWSIKSNV